MAAVGSLEQERAVGLGAGRRWEFLDGVPWARWSTLANPDDLF